jgi:hypothetical protein
MLRFLQERKYAREMSARCHGLRITARFNMPAVNPLRRHMKQFVPMTDDMLFDAQQFVGPFVPYQYGVPCVRRMRDEEQRIVPAKEVTSTPTANLPA